MRTVVAAVVLFFGYLGMAMTMPINADGASNALQAWEMLHGNVLLKGWTVTDVPFYSTELPQYALIELFYGLHEHVFRIAAAMTCALLVILVAYLARGRQGNRFGMWLAVAIVLLPMPGVGYLVAFGGPNHLGTAVPLLVTWLVLDRLSAQVPTSTQAAGSASAQAPTSTQAAGPASASAAGPAAAASQVGAMPRLRLWAQSKGRHPAFLPALIALLLVWGQVGDPLVMYIGAAPLALVSAYRWWRGRERLDVGLFAASLASVLTAKGILKVIDLAGGFEAHSPPSGFSSPAKWLDHLDLLGEVTLVNFGAYLPDMRTPVDTGIAVIRLGGLGLAVAAVAVTVVTALRAPRAPKAQGDRVNQILAVAICVNCAAFVASTLPTDLLSARQVSVVLPLGAALAGRVFKPRFKPVLAALLVLFAGVFAWHAAQPARPEPKREIVAWLEGRGLTHGLGSYWNANDLTLIAQNRITVAPVIGPDMIKAYRWESKVDWYDPARSDARFIIIDVKRPAFGTVDLAYRQFGAPTETRTFDQFAILIYDRNLLVGLPAECGGRVAPSMLECDGDRSREVRTA